MKARTKVLLNSLVFLIAILLTLALVGKVDWLAAIWISFSMFVAMLAVIAWD